MIELVTSVETQDPSSWIRAIGGLSSTYASQEGVIVEVDDLDAVSFNNQLKLQGVT